MQIKGIEFSVNNRKQSIVFPNKKSIILKGNNTNELFSVMERLLGQDMTDYYPTIDEVEYNILYQKIGMQSQLHFTDGVLIGKDLTVKKSGSIPTVHCIRYLKNNKFRSFITEDKNKHNNQILFTNTTKYSDSIPMTTWQRIITTVNSFIGAEFVSYDMNTRQLVFATENAEGWTYKAEKIIYMLISECYLTPEGISRVLLLPQIECMTAKQEMELIEVLDNIKGHCLLLSDINVSFNDIPKNSALTVISI